MSETYKFDAVPADRNFFSFSLHTQSPLTMFPAGVILVFCLLFVIACLVAGVFIHKSIKSRKSNQRF